MLFSGFPSTSLELMAMKNFLQQALFNILKSVGRGVISLRPLVLCYTEGVVISGSPLGKPAFVKADLAKRLAKLEKLEDLIADASRGASRQGMLQLVQQCVATTNPHLARDEGLRSQSRRPLGYTLVVGLGPRGGCV